MSDHAVMFGMFMPQGWKMELAGIDGAAQKWQSAVDIAVRAEELGYASIWVYDHFHNVPRPAHEAVFECWTTIAAISQRTSRVRLGQRGRMQQLPAPERARQDHLDGRCDQRRSPRLGDRRRLVRERVPRLRVRLPPPEWSPEVFIRSTEAEVAAAGSRSLSGEPFESWRDGNLVGTPDQVSEKIRTYVDLGCTGFIPLCSDYPDTESLELLATEVIPNFRERDAAVARRHS